MAQYGMLIYTTRCMGCQTCVIGCKISNDTPVFWGRLVSNLTDGDPYKPQGTYPNAKFSFRAELCNHCADPACVAVCPTGAMHKREEDGVVLSDKEICIGCGSCVEGCPYSVPQLDTANSVSSKCDLCYARLANDELPWCVQSCPAEARVVGDISDATSEISQLIASTGAKQLYPENGTNPSVYYV